MKLTDISLDLVKYRFQNLGKGSGSPRITLPPIAEDLGISSSGEIQLEYVDEDEPTYLRGVKKREIGDYGNGVVSCDLIGDRRFNIPARFKDMLPEPGHQVAVEVNLIGEPHFRIYRLLEFVFGRIPELREHGYGPDQGDPIKIENFDGSIDLAAATPYPGQRCKIVPVNPEFEPLVNEARTGENRDKVLINTEYVKEFTQERSIPSKHADMLAIRWQPDVPTIESAKEFQEQITSSQPKTVFTPMDYSEQEVIVPKQGGIKIWGGEAGKMGNTWIIHAGEEFGANEIPYGDRIIDDWSGKYFDAQSDESTIKLYLPIPFIQKGDPDVWWS